MNHALVPLMIRRRKQTAEAGLSSHVANSVETIAALHARGQHEDSPHIRLISRLSAKIGRPSFLVVVITTVFSWIGLNLAAIVFGMRPVDPPPFSWLQGAISLSALLVTTIVLITQNRQTRPVEERARLDLQINLLAEQKVTKLIELIEELRRDMPNVRNRVDTLADEMKEPLDTDAVLSVLEKTSRALQSGEEPDSVR